MAESYHFLARNKTLYDVMLSQASAGTLAGKVNVLGDDDLDFDEDGSSVTFECGQCMTEMTIPLPDESPLEPGTEQAAVGKEEAELGRAWRCTSYLTQCDSCSLYYRLDLPN